MLRRFTHRVPMLLSLVVPLAILASVSASANGVIGDEGGRGESKAGDPHYDGHDLEISMDFHWRNGSRFDWMKSTFSNFRDHSDRGDDHSFHQHLNKREELWKPHRRWAHYKKQHDGWRHHKKHPMKPPTKPVPEPSTAVLMLLGLAGLAGTTRRTRS